MRKQTKGLLIMLCVALLVVGSIVGVLAYLTDQEKAKNTFTVGNVAIDLNETDVDKDQNTKANGYHLLPGHTYVKDPTVTVLEGSDSAYIRMIVTVSDYAGLKAAFPASKYSTWYSGDDFLLQNLVEGWSADKWECVSITDAGVYEFRYCTPVAGPEDDGDGVVEGLTLEPLFTKVVIPGTVTNTELAELQGIKINVEAHAIQSAGFADAAEAWSNF